MMKKPLKYMIVLLLLSVVASACHTKSHMIQPDIYRVKKNGRWYVTDSFDKLNESRLP